MFGVNERRAINEIVKQLSYDKIGFGADFMIQSNADGNGNYQTITYKKGGPDGDIVQIVEITFDGNNNIVTYHKTK